ncbi:hypothetical protein GQX74_015072 [Glossina fuscipes]|nr:hypothetical protein GQX74_015072 [Glossina fuscipes]
MLKSAVKTKEFLSKMNLRDEKSAIITPAYFHGCVENSILDLFGEISGYSELELIQFSKAQKRGVFKVPKTFYEQIRASIALIGHYQDIPCHFEVLRDSEECIEI